MFGISHTSKKFVAVADVSSGSVGVAILAIEDNRPATVMHDAHTSLSLDERSVEATAAGTLKSLQEAGDKVLADFSGGPHKGARISASYAIIGAPWTHSKTTRADSVFEKETRITNTTITSLAQKAIAEEKDFDRSNLLESSIVRVELNGYATGVPLGKTAHHISTVALISDCEPSIRTGTTETLQKLFPHTKPILRSSARALTAAFSIIPSISKESVIVDIRTQATTVLVVRDALVVNYSIVNEGIASILKRVSEKGVPEETLSTIRMVERDECADDTCKVMNDSMAHAEIELARVYGDALTKIATPVRLPPNLVLVTHPDLMPWLTTFFSRIDFNQCTITSQPFLVHGLESAQLGTCVVSESDAPIDIGLLIASTLVNSEEAE